MIENVYVVEREAAVADSERKDSAVADPAYNESWDFESVELSDSAAADSNS